MSIHRGRGLGLLSAMMALATIPDTTGSETIEVPRASSRIMPPKMPTERVRRVRFRDGDPVPGWLRKCKRKRGCATRRPWGAGRRRKGQVRK